MASAVSPQTGRLHAGDEAAMQLQRRFAQESGDRDAAKLTLHRLKTAVDFYRQRLQGLVARSAAPGAGDEESLVHRVRDLVKDMDSEVRGTLNDSSLVRASIQVAGPFGSSLSASPPPQKGKSYEVLRQSLEEAQRRCESLNSDMVHQSEANEELVETLNTVKDQNKRHLEQIRQQNAEVANLTQQRVSDEERMDQMTRKHESEREVIRQDTQRQVLMVRESHTENYNQAHSRLTDKLRYVQARSEMLHQDTVRLIREMQERKGDAAALQSAVQGHLQAADRDLILQCEAPRKRHELWKQGTEDTICDLNLKLKAEREARADEGLSWAQKHGMAGSEKEDSQACMTRELTQLKTQLQALQRTLAGERQSWLEDRAGLERQADDSFQQQNSRKMALDQLQRDIVSIETAISAAKSEIDSFEHVAVELKSRVRESDDALAAAVSGNEHLRDQMEEQRQRFQEKNETDLSDCRADFEQKIADERVTHEADAVMTSKQIEAMDHEIRNHDEELQKLVNQASTIGDECTSFARDTTMWRSQFDSAKVGREALEKEFGEAKRIFQGQRLKLQAGIDQMANESAALEDEVKLMAVELHSMKRDATSRETQSATHQASAVTALKDTQETAVELQHRLKDVQDVRARICGEANYTRERMAEVQLALERNLDSQGKSWDDERRRINEQLDSERRAAEQAHEEFSRERDTTHDQLRRVADDSRAKLAGVEKERARLQESSTENITQGKQVVSQLQAHVKALEHDLNRVHALCAESEANSAWIRQEQQNLERDASRDTRSFEEEVRAIGTSLEIAKRDEAALTQQTQVHKQRNEQDNAQLRRALDGAGGSSVAAAEPRTIRQSSGSGYPSWRPMTSR